MCTINSKVYRTYRGQAATHVGVGHREAGLIDGLLKHKVNDSFKPFFCVDCEICYLLHQLIEHLGCELVQNATNFPEQLLKCQKTDCKHIAFKTTKQPLYKINTLYKRDKSGLEGCESVKQIPVPDKNKSIQHVTTI